MNSNKRSNYKKTVKNPYEGDIHSVLITLLKTQFRFSHKGFSWISNGGKNEQLILGRNFLKILFDLNSCGV